MYDKNSLYHCSLCANKAFNLQKIINLNKKTNSTLFFILN